MVKGTQQTGMNSGQKTGIVFLVLLTCLVVLFSVVKIYNIVYGPFRAQIAVAGASANIMNQKELLRHMDTDHDGLSNYDEIYVYHTNPYLADTDSDGIPDKVEIEQGTNPLCPQGRTCNGDAIANIVATASSSINGVTSSMSGISVVSPTTILSKATDNSKVLGLDALVNNPQQLRKLLLSTGKISSSTLSKVSDIELVTFAKQQLASQQSSSTGQ